MKTALITGASSGIGKEFAYLFAQNGIQLVLVARRINLLNEIAREIELKYKIKCYAIQADLAKMDEVDLVVKKILENNLSIDYLVNNAGFGLLGNFLQLDWQSQYKMIELNIAALSYLTHKILPFMVDKKSGSILNLASTAAFLPGPGMAVYFATKAFVLSFSEALSVELRNTGVSVTALCPGPTRSEFAKVAGAKNGMMFNKSIPDAESVARYGFKMMMKNKTVAVHGFKNRFLSLFLLRFTPRKLVARMVYFMTNK